MPSTGKTKYDKFLGPLILNMWFQKTLKSAITDPIKIEPQNIRKFTITLALDKFLPEFNLQMNDSTGLFTHVIPFDHSMSKFHVAVGRRIRGLVEDTTLFNFDVYKREPNSDLIYDATGLLEATNLFAPKYMRAHTGTIKETIEGIATAIGAKRSEVSSSLKYKKTILQPGWSNAKLLNWLKENVTGQNSEAAYYCFMKCVDNDPVFVFQSIKDFWAKKPKYRYTLSSEVVKDTASGDIFWPVMQYQLIENYKTLGVRGMRRQQCGYYDYGTSSYKIGSYEIDRNEDPNLDYNSFTEYHQIDSQDDANAHINTISTGRSNGFTNDFKGKTLNEFHKNITKLSRIWIDVIGVDDIYPGDIVDVMYLEEQPPAGRIGYQHQGFWMVERVVHVMGGEFVTRLLLTRNGSDSSLRTQLLMAKTRKRK